MPVVLATWEAEMEGSLEPRRYSGCSDHYTPAWATENETLLTPVTSLKKKKIQAASDSHYAN